MLLKIGFIQPQAQEDTSAVVQIAVEQSQNAIKQGCQLVILPELFASGYTHIDKWQPLESLQDHQLSGFLQLTKQHQVTIVVGTVPFLAPNTTLDVPPRIYNRALAFSCCEPYVAYYDKLQLFYPFDEHKTFLPGNKLGGIIRIKVDNEFFNAGMLICNDLRYPEICRSYALQGCDILLCPSRFSLKRLEPWRILTAARAVENQCILVAANVCNDKYGPSRVIEPDGHVAFESQPAPILQIAHTDLSKLASERRELAVLQRRRNDIYDKY